MNYITSTMEYKTLKSKYGSSDKMIETAFSTAEISLYAKLTREMMGLEVSKSKQAYVKEEVMNDLGICAYYRLRNEVLKYKLDNYNNIETFNIAGQYESVMNIAKELISKDMPLPSSFIKLFRDKISKEYLENRLKQLSKTYHVDMDSLEEDFETLPFLKDIKEVIEEGTKDSVSEKCFVAILKIVQTYKYLTKDGKISLDIFPNMVKMLYREVYYTNAANGERLATKREKKKMLAGVFKKKTHLLNSESEKNILICTWVMTNKDLYYGMVQGLLKIESRKDKIKTYVDDIITSMDYMVSHEFMQEDSVKILNEPVFNDYLDSAEDEIVENIKVLDMLKLVKKELDPEYGTAYENLAWNIANDCLRKKKYDLSEKQVKIIENNYNSIMRKKQAKDPDGQYKEVGNQQNKEIKNNAYCDELLDKAKEVKKFVNKQRNKNSNTYYKMVLDIVDRILKNKYATEKQANIIYKMYEEKIENPFTEMLNSVDAIESDDSLADENGNDNNLVPPPLFGDVSSIFVD